MESDRYGHRDMDVFVQVLYNESHDSRKVRWYYRHQLEPIAASQRYADSATAFNTNPEPSMIAAFKMLYHPDLYRKYEWDNAKTLWRGPNGNGPREQERSRATQDDDLQGRQKKDARNAEAKLQSRNDLLKDHAFREIVALNPIFEVFEQSPIGVRRRILDPADELLLGMIDAASKSAQQCRIDRYERTRLNERTASSSPLFEPRESESVPAPPEPAHLDVHGLPIEPTEHQGQSPASGLQDSHLHSTMERTEDTGTSRTQSKHDLTNFAEAVDSATSFNPPRLSLMGWCIDRFKPVTRS